MQTICIDEGDVKIMVLRKATFFIILALLELQSNISKLSTVLEKSETVKFADDTDNMQTCKNIVHYRTSRKYICTQTHTQSA